MKTPELHLNPNHPSSMQERANRRLRPSNDSLRSDEMYQHGNSPTRTITTIHHPGQNRVHKRSEKGGDYR